MKYLLNLFGVRCSFYVIKIPKRQWFETTVYLTEEGDWADKISEAKKFDKTHCLINIWQRWEKITP